VGLQVKFWLQILEAKFNIIKTQQKKVEEGLQ
jgi:hypothetical protein